MYRVIIAISSMSLVQSTKGQVQQKGQCVKEPEHVVVDLDIPAFMGTWYQIARIPNNNEIGNCTATTFKLVDESTGTILMVDRELTEHSIEERYGNITFSGGRFHSTFDKIKPDYYWVAGVQYNDYALLYSCENVDSAVKEVYGWMLSRTREMSPVADEGFPEALYATADLHEVAWTWTEQGDYCDGYQIAE